MLSVNELRILQAGLRFAQDQMRKQRRPLAPFRRALPISPGDSPASRKSAFASMTNGAPWPRSCKAARQRNERPDTSYSRPADVLALMLDGFLTIEEGREKHRKAGGNAAEFEAFVKRHRRELISDAEAGF